MGRIINNSGRLGKHFIVSLPILFASLIVISLFLSSALLMWRGWQGAHLAIEKFAEQLTLSMSSRINEKMRSFIDVSAANIHRLTHAPLGKHDDYTHRSQKIVDFINVLNSSPVVSAIYTAYPDGTFIIVRSISNKNSYENEIYPDKAEYILILSDVNKSNFNDYYFFSLDADFVSKMEIKGDDFDPRVRDWYRLAQESPGPHLSDPYYFFNTSVSGISLSEKARQEDVVLGMDIDLSMLGDQMRHYRPTANAEYAIVAEGKGVVARAKYNNYDNLNIASNYIDPIDILMEIFPPNGRSVSFEAENKHWFGVNIPLASIGDGNFRLFVAIPDSDLTVDLWADFRQQAVIAGIFTFGLMILGWFIGKWVGASVARVTAHARHLSNFDFVEPPSSGSRILEVRDLENALASMGGAMRNFLSTVEAIGTEPQLDRMLDRVLQHTVLATRSTLGAVYLHDATGHELEFAASAYRGGHGEKESGEEFPEKLPITALDVARPSGLGLPGHSPWIKVPLTDRADKPVGLLLLCSPDTGIGDKATFRHFVIRLSSAVSATIETRHLVETQQRLFNGIIHLMADAIDAKSPYTGSHCRRVPELAIMMVDEMRRSGHSPYGPYHPSEQQRYAFRLGAWLHDCGKIISPESIVEKATKLEAVYNRIHEVRTRFEVLWRDAEIAHLQRLVAGEDETSSAALRDAEQAQLQDDFAFVASCNIGGEFIADEDLARLLVISGKTWTRHFSDRAGLSREEAERVAGISEPILPVVEQLLADRPEHGIAWDKHRPPVEKDDPANLYGFDMHLPLLAQNLGEIHNLSIKRGTLTSEDRFRVNAHVVQTFIMLHSLPWPDELKIVPEMAATHHERMDGEGYPFRMDAHKLTLEERVMAIADVFEALTAADRPYKPPIPFGDALAIMTNMAMEGHLDPLLMRRFLETRMWEHYGRLFLGVKQPDPVDVDFLVAQLPDSAPPPPTWEEKTRSVIKHKSIQDPKLSV